MIISFVFTLYQHFCCVSLMMILHQVRLSKDWKEIVDVVRGSQPNLMKEENGYRKVYHLVAEKLMVKGMHCAFNLY